MHPYIAYQIWSEFGRATATYERRQKVVFVASALWWGGARLQRGRAIRLTARMCDTLTHLLSSMSVLYANIWPVVVSHTLLSHMLLLMKTKVLVTSIVIVAAVRHLVQWDLRDLETLWPLVVPSQCSGCYSSGPSGFQIP